MTPAVFVGGSIVVLLLTDETSPQPRATADVDVVVISETRAQFNRVTERLMEAGHQPDPNGPICRWIIDGVLADVMPMSEEILGFSNRWYGRLHANAEQAELPDGNAILIASAPYLIASKLEAFRSRGRNDLRMSHDITDVVAVIDGRPELCEEIRAAEFEVREYIQAEFRDLIVRNDFLLDFEGHLPADPFSGLRLPIVRKRITSIANNDC